MLSLNLKRKCLLQKEPSNRLSKGKVKRNVFVIAREENNRNPHKEKIVD